MKRVLQFTQAFFTKAYNVVGPNLDGSIKELDGLIKNPPRRPPLPTLEESKDEDDSDDEPKVKESKPGKKSSKESKESKANLYDDSFFEDDEPVKPRKEAKPKVVDS